MKNPPDLNHISTDLINQVVLLNVQSLVHMRERVTDLSIDEIDALVDKVISLNLFEAPKEEARRKIIYWLQEIRAAREREANEKHLAAIETAVREDKWGKVAAAAGVIAIVVTLLLALWKGHG